MKRIFKDTRGMTMADITIIYNHLSSVPVKRFPHRNVALVQVNRLIRECRERPGWLTRLNGLPAYLRELFDDWDESHVRPMTPHERKIMKAIVKIMRNKGMVSVEALDRHAGVENLHASLDRMRRRGMLYFVSRGMLAPMPSAIAALDEVQA